MKKVWAVLNIDTKNNNGSDFEGVYLTEDEAIYACRDDLLNAAICRVVVGERPPGHAKDADCLYYPNHKTMNKEQQINFFK